MKIYKLIFCLLIAAVLLTGCTLEAFHNDLERSSKVCENNGGVKSYFISGPPTPAEIRAIVCNNGATFHSPFKEFTNE